MISNVIATKRFWHYTCCCHYQKQLKSLSALRTSQTDFSFIKLYSTSCVGL